MRKSMLKRGVAAVLTLALVFAALGCDARQVILDFRAAIAGASAAAGEHRATATPEPTATPKPTATPQPHALIGAVGDIMVMEIQSDRAYDAESDSFDFSETFHYINGLLHSADLMCGNLETTLAGEEYPYGGTYSDMHGNSAFSAPDALLTDLLEAGFDVLTTANNHCCDYGVKGIFRTAQTVRDAGLIQSGTYTSEEDRNTARIVEINGIRIGIIAWTEVSNGRAFGYSPIPRSVAIGELTRDNANVLSDISVLKEAGAEFIVAFPHWDSERHTSPDSTTRYYAAWLLESGVDCIIGSHPHVVQPVEWLTVTRETGEYTGLVAYSVGNFMANMSDDTRYSMYLQLTLTRDTDGVISLTDIAYLPLLIGKAGDNLVTIYPALSDLSPLAEAGAAMSELMARECAKARTYVETIAGSSAARLMEDAEWIACSDDY